MPYIQNTEDDINLMLKKINKESIDSLFDVIPSDLQYKSDLDLPLPTSESELLLEMQKKSARNLTVDCAVSFLGGGAYNHFIPSALEEVASRGEFYTAYTPYQAEASQGMLQSFFEYQSMICEITAMDVANASHYDGATAAAEAAVLSFYIKKKKRHTILIPENLNPEYLSTIKTYLLNMDVNIKTVKCKNGKVDIEHLRESVNEDTASFILQTPNFFGCVEDVFEISKIVKGVDGLLISIVYPISLGILTPPGEYDSDIAVGDGQSLGNDIAYGGPYAGFFTIKNEYVRSMPGRVVGQTVDRDNNRAFCLTLQTREQHIRRERASSNICSNQALCALRNGMYLALVGKEGLARVAKLCFNKAHYMTKQLANIDGLSLSFDEPFFNEFCITLPKSVSAVNKQLLNKGYIGGLDVSKYTNIENTMLLAVTEVISKKDMDGFVDAIKEILIRGK